MTSQKSILLIDMDGTGWDYVGGFNRIWKVLYPDRPVVPDFKITSFYLENMYPKEWEKDIRAITTSKEFFKNLKLYPGAKEALDDILNDDRFDPFLCSSPDIECIDQCCFTEKAQSVLDTLGEEWLKRLILTKDKTIINGDYLIDDKPDIKGAISPSWKQIFYPQAYNVNCEGLRLEGGWANWKKFKQTLR
jgi:5'-nucleotidase